MSGHTTTVSFPDIPSVTATTREYNGIEQHCVVAGDPADPLVVLLHGFPEFWYGWHRQLRPLVDAGYRVLVPDQRGYNATDKPQSVAQYRMPKLTNDIESLIASEGRDSAHVVGHDWGGIVAWYLGMRQPEMVETLSILNIPHPLTFVESLATDLSQLQRSWYLFFFQLPSLPERLWQRFDAKLWRYMFQKPTPTGTFSELDRERYLAVWDQPGARTGMISWYRAGMRYPLIPSWKEIDVPTLILWGDGDQALKPELASESLDYCSTGRLERFPDASHWLHHEYPHEVANQLCEQFES